MLKNCIFLYNSLKILLFLCIVSGGEDRIMTVSDYNGDTKFEVKFMILDSYFYYFYLK